MASNPNLGRATEDAALEVLMMLRAGRSHAEIGEEAVKLHRLVRTLNGTTQTGLGLIRDGFIPNQVMREYGDVINLFGPSPVLEDSVA